MIYITKMQCKSEFYLQIFTGVQCGFLVSRGWCPIGKDFVPNPTNHIRIYGRNRLLSVFVVLPNLQQEAEQNLCL